jgi:predicted CXXCH cytochrome family protein
MRIASSDSGLSQVRGTSLLFILPLIAILAGCTTEKVIFRDREPFNEPVEAAAGFLGYFSTDPKVTTCGNCHAGHQTSWATTAHADAWAALPANAASTCKSCHSVTGLGNTVSGQAGYDATQNAIYHDVQCENCHGPGLNHVKGVGQGMVVRPLAKLAASGDGTCAECHSGTHHPFAEEWSQSAHAANDHNGATCIECHEGRGALAKWGVKTNYAERDVTTSYQGITCSVCHDPHGSANGKQLRFAIDDPTPSANLCMKCHMRRVEPLVTSSSGPHGPQAAVLLGTAGYRPTGFEYAEGLIFGSHATDANPRLCAGCHVNRYTVTDPQGGFVFQATGHLFRPAPCLDAQGKPTADKSCAYTATARSWASCVGSGCHNSAAVAANVFNTRRALIKLLADEIWRDLDADGNLDAAPTDAGMLATLKQTQPGQWSTSDSKITPAEGAEFNARLCGEYGSSNSDNSKGAHNPFLCQALLVASINELHSFYGLPSPPAAVQAILDAPMRNAQVSRKQIPGYEVTRPGAYK